MREVNICPVFFIFLDKNEYYMIALRRCSCKKSETLLPRLKKQCFGMVPVSPAVVLTWIYTVLIQYTTLPPPPRHEVKFTVIIFSFLAKYLLLKGKGGKKETLSPYLVCLRWVERQPSD